MRISYRTLAGLIDLMSEEQKNKDVTVKITDNGSNYYAGELQVTTEEVQVNNEDNILKKGHPVIYVHFGYPGDRQSNVDFLAVDIGLVPISVKKKKYGFFSKEQKDQIGSVIYLNKEGKEVEITTVREVAEPHPGFTDMVCVGEIVKYVRHNQKC